MASEVKVVGSVNAGPSSPTGGSQLSVFMDLGLDKTYPIIDAGSVVIASSDGVPYVINGGGISAFRFVAIKSLDGASLKVKLSSALGADQVVPVSDELVLHVPAAGDQFTAVKVVGTGRIEFFVAGS